MDLGRLVPLNVAGYNDNRLIYAASNTAKFINPLTAAGQYSATGTLPYNVTQLGNSNKGYYFSFNTKLEKQFSNGFSAMIAYVRNDARNLFDGGGDQPASAFQGTATVNGSPNQKGTKLSIPHFRRLLILMEQKYLW